MSLYLITCVDLNEVELGRNTEVSIPNSVITNPQSLPGSRFSIVLVTDRQLSKFLNGEYLYFWNSIRVVSISLSMNLAARFFLLVWIIGPKLNISIIDVIMFQLWHIMNFYTGAFLDFYTGDTLTLNRQSLVSFDYFK